MGGKARSQPIAITVEIWQEKCISSSYLEKIRLEVGHLVVNRIKWTEAVFETANNSTFLKVPKANFSLGEQDWKCAEKATI